MWLRRTLDSHYDDCNEKSRENEDNSHSVQMWHSAVEKTDTCASDPSRNLYRGQHICEHSRTVQQPPSPETYEIGDENMPLLGLKVAVSNAIHLDDRVCCTVLIAVMFRLQGSKPKMKLMEAQPNTQASQFQYPA